MIISLNSFAQSKEAKARNFIESYNQNQYRKMKADLFFLGKMIISRKMMKEVVSDVHKMYGQMTIIKITTPSENIAEAYLTSEKDPGEVQVLEFTFNKRNKIQSFYFKIPEFIYPLDTLIKENTLTLIAKGNKIDSLVRSKHDNADFNGCVLAIDSGKVIYRNCFGYSNYETKSSLNDSSVFELASCSKQFTAMAIMMLAEQGKIKYSDTIQKYIPNLPYGNITIHNLLTHTSGLPDYMDMMEKHWNKNKIATNNDMVQLFEIHKPKTEFHPGERFSYSNTGYALLSLIIEQASGSTYHDFLRKNIFLPLNMNHSMVLNTRSSSHQPLSNYAYGYVFSASKKKYCLPDSLPEYEFVYYLSGITGDGTVNSTITDLALWDKGLRDNKLVCKSTSDLSCTGSKLKNGRRNSYGYGVEIIDKPQCQRIVNHSGGWPGYHTFILRFLDSEKTIVILSNNEYPSFDMMADKIAKILLDAR